MPTFIGDRPLQRVYVGQHRVEQVYRGDRLVWQLPTGGRWKFTFPGRAGAYSVAEYAKDVDRLDCETSTFPVSVASGYPGLYLATANPMQYSSNTVLHVRSPLLAPPPGTELLIEFELAMTGADNGALRFSLFDDQLGMVFDKTGLEANMTPSLWSGNRSAGVGLHSCEVAGDPVGDHKPGHAAIWVHDGRAHGYVGGVHRGDVAFDESTMRIDAPMDIRVQAKAAFMAVPVPPAWVPIPIPIFPPVMHALITHIGTDAAARAAELGYQR